MWYERRKMSESMFKQARQMVWGGLRRSSKYSIQQRCFKGSFFRDLHTKRLNIAWGSGGILVNAFVKYLQLEGELTFDSVCVNNYVKSLGAQNFPKVFTFQNKVVKTYTVLQRDSLL